MGNYSNVLFIWAVWFKCYHCQDSVSIQQSPATAYEGDPLTLTCTYTGSNSPFTVIWYRNNAASGMTVRISTCAIVGTPAPDYEVSRYSFTCSNPYTLKISQTSLADNRDVWGCTVGILGVTSPSVNQTKLSITKKDQNNLLLLLILLILLPVSIIVILIVCGCLDCCRCCRDFDHYEENKWLYVTWYCLKRGCCSFFCCRPGRKKGKCFCGDKKGCCGGCNSCQIKCRCGWPDLFKSKDRISCGCCFCICCVQELKDQGLDETTVAITGPPALYTEKKNKVHPLPKLPSVRGVTLGETVELKEPRKKNKKKKKDKLDLEKSAEKAAKRNSPEDQDIPGEKLN